MESLLNLQIGDNMSVDVRQQPTCGIQGFKNNIFVFTCCMLHHIAEG
jgi:hypothetical protein